MLGVIINNTLIFLLFFFLLCLSSFFYRIQWMLIVIVFGMSWSYFRASPWLGEWMYGALTSELYEPRDFPIFTSGLAALGFLIILILSTILLVRRVYLYWKGPKSQCTE